MAAFNFPNSPSTNDLHTENSVTWKWNGTVWKRVNNSYLTASTLNVSGIGTFGGNVSIADKIIHTGDTNTAIRFPAVDQIQLETGGSSRVNLTDDRFQILNRLLTSGDYNYLSGTSSTHTTLTLKKSASGADSIDYLQLRDNSNAIKLTITGDGTLKILDSIVHEGDTNTKIRFPAADTFSVETAGLQNFKVNGTRVALTSPSGTNTTVRLQHQGNSGYGDIILDRTVNAFIIDNDPSNASNNQSYFSVKNKGTENLRILHDGRICMGSTNVGSGSADDLNIENTSDHGGITIRTPNNKWGSIHFADGGTGNELYRGQLSYDHSNDKMLIYVGSSQSLQIDSSGRLGVSHDLSGTANYNRLMLHNPHDGSCWMQMTSTASGSSANSDGLSIGLNSSNMGHIWLRENAPLAFATNATERLRIMSDGQVNIATTANYGTIGSAAAFQIYGSNAGGNVSQNIINHAAANASSTCDINIWQNYRLANRIIFGRENNNNWQSSATSAASYMAFYTNSAGTVAERLRITSAGHITSPTHCCFEVKLMSSQSFTSGSRFKINFTRVENQQGTSFDTSNNRFTAPVAGYYQFNVGVYSYYSTFMELDGRCNGASTGVKTYRPTTRNDNGADGNPGASIMASWIVKLAKDDYYEIFCQCNSAHGTKYLYADINRTPTWWSGFLIC